MARTRRNQSQIQEDIKSQSKVCGTCGERKSFSEFYNYKNKSDEKCYRCKLCDNAARAAYRKKHQASVKGETRERNLKLRFGMTHADYLAILKSQNYSCAICGIHHTDARITSGRTDYLAVDHCHETGGIRGLLCNKCNLALGFLGDSQDLLHKAAKYLKEYEDCL